jgi:putative transposase
LGIKRKRVIAVQKKKGIVSVRPNEFLHVDTTYIETPERKKIGITFVTDNFSKMILGVSVGWGISFLRIKEALALALTTIRLHHPQTESSVLVSDGGSENTAIGVKEFLNALEQPGIHHRIGLKTIEFSNSPVEAINKIMKQYLRRQTFYSPTQVLNFLEKKAIPDYNEIRPHVSLKGLTPLESYGLKSVPPEWNDQLAIARKERIAYNRKSKCSKC